MFHFLLQLYRIWVSVRSEQATNSRDEGKKLSKAQGKNHGLKRSTPLITQWRGKLKITDEQLAVCSLAQAESVGVLLERLEGGLVDWRVWFTGATAAGGCGGVQKHLLVVH